MSLSSFHYFFSLFCFFYIVSLFLSKCCILYPIRVYYILLKQKSKQNASKVPSKIQAKCKQNTKQNASKLPSKKNKVANL